LSQALSTGGAGAEERDTFNKHAHNVILMPEIESVALTVGCSAPFRTGVGLYSLLDHTGRPVSLEGDILHPTDAGYLLVAEEPARSLGLWQVDTRPGADSAYHAVSWVAEVDPGVSYAVLGVSNLSASAKPAVADAATSGHYSSLSAANPNCEVCFASRHGRAAYRLGFEDLPDGGDNDPNDVTSRTASCRRHGLSR